MELRIVTIQCAPFQDGTDPEGAPTFKLPYPLHGDAQGKVQNQELWKGNPAEVVGFTPDLTIRRIVLPWSQVFRAPDQCVGMFAVIRNDNGSIGALATPVESTKIITLTVDDPDVHLSDGDHRLSAWRL